jgi:hypothetical protein
VKNPLAIVIGPLGEVLIYREDSGGFLLVFNSEQKRLKGDLYNNLKANFELARLMSGVIDIDSVLLEAIIEAL